MASHKPGKSSGVLVGHAGETALGSADSASRPLCVRPVSHARPSEIEEEGTGVCEGAALHPRRR